MLKAVISGAVELYLYLIYYIIFFRTVLYKWEHYNLCKSRIIPRVTIAQHYKSTINSELNAYTAHLCICANHSTNLNYKIKITFFSFGPYGTVSSHAGSLGFV